MEYVLMFWLTVGVTVLCLYQSDGQVYVFQSIEDHNQRLSAMESTIANMTTCCNAIRNENELLKQVTANLTSMLESLTKEVELLKLHSKSGEQTTTTGASTAAIAQTSSTLYQQTNAPKTVTTPSSTIQPKSSPTTSQPKMTPTSTLPPKSIPTTTGQPKMTLTKSPRTSKPSTTHSTPIEGQDCADLYKKGVRKSGVYQIRTSLSKGTVMAYCDMEHDGGGWTMIQRRKDGSVNFNRDWASYRDGFGNVSGEFWLGNEHIHDLTRSGNYRLRIQVMDWVRVTGYAEYQYFRVMSESSNYRLSVGSYKGNIGDSFNYPNSYLLRHNQMPFSTKDRDNDKSFNNCARILKGGWWFNACYSSNLNGQFSKTGPYGTHTMGEIAGEPTLEGTGVEWYPWKQKQYSLVQSEMKIRPETFP